MFEVYRVECNVYTHSAQVWGKVNLETPAEHHKHCA